MEKEALQSLLKEVIREVAPIDQPCAEQLAKIDQEIEKHGLEVELYQRLNNQLSYYSLHYPQHNTSQIVQLQETVLRQIQRWNGAVSSTIWLST